MTSYPRVLLDCDNVLSDFVGGVLPLIAEVTGRPAAREGWTRWEFAESFGLSPAESREVLCQIDRPGFCRDLDVLPGAQDGVSALRNVAQVFVVTTPWPSGPTWDYERRAWLLEHLDIHASHVIQCSAKHLVAGDVFVDDKTSTLEAWAAEHPRGEAVRWRTPHNRGELWGGAEASDWGAIRERVLVAQARHVLREEATG